MAVYGYAHFVHGKQKCILSFLPLIFVSDELAYYKYQNVFVEDGGQT